MPDGLQVPCNLWILHSPVKSLFGEFPLGVGEGGVKAVF